MSSHSHNIDDVFGVSRDVPLNYVSRSDVDDTLIGSLTRSHHIVIFGSSKQGKTSLRKNCLNDSDYVVISCQNRWSLAELQSAILKEAGYVVRQSTSKTVSGTAKISASASGKLNLPLIGGGEIQANATGDGSVVKTDTTTILELDPQDANDIIRALTEVEFDKYIVMEDFHYLPDETQRDFSYALKAFHEKSKFCFIIVGVWREKNRLITYNGDLTDRVFSVDVDTWTDDHLFEVINAGEALLNTHFSDEFKAEVVKRSFESVHLVQEACRRCCRHHQIFTTQSDLKKIGTREEAIRFIKEVVDEQSGRYQGFLMSFADGFQQTELEMPRWIIYAILTATIEDLENGIRLRELSRKIKSAHPQGEGLNNGNITQALNSATSLQSRKGIRPIVIDYDTANRNLHVVDKGFLIWLANQDVNEILEDLNLPFDDGDVQGPLPF